MYPYLGKESFKLKPLSSIVDIFICSQPINYKNKNEM